MAISFACECGKALKARDELAGKKTKCPECGTILAIPRPEVDPDLGDGLPYGLEGEGPAEAPGPAPSPAGAGFGSMLDDETAIRPSVYHAMPTAPSRSSDRPRPTAASASASAPAAARPAPTFAFEDKTGSKSSIREYAYLLLAFALVPLIFSLLGGEAKMDIEQRVELSLKNATPEQMARAIPVLAKGEGLSKEELLAVLPDGRLHGAHLAHDSTMHWVYAGIATVGFLLLVLSFFAVERANPLHLLGIGLFTGTVGIIFLIVVQFCSQFRVARFGRGWFALVMLILMFIGWSYRSALDPGSNFFLSMLGFTFGVGLCEEFTKAIPLFFYFQRDARMGWRGACLWGLASGIGFGVSEGIMYSSDTYNGIHAVDAYVVRFVSCVALHAMWSASVGIAIARNLDDYEGLDDAAGFGLFMMRIIAMPMLLHGAYDTLLKMDMNVWALVVALVSFGWLAIQIELARGAMPDAGTGRKRKRLAH